MYFHPVMCLGVEIPLQTVLKCRVLLLTKNYYHCFAFLGRNRRAAVKSGYTESEQRAYEGNQVAS